ncbi:glycosyltransferase [Neobacillus sp. 3P2-tot-E-2]|uniref:glycosyltransferase n=1 Tax=Neobacillus sp. 3P2-tot-E-2 TaxID=3132212 RepID=UPI0039A35766
MVRKKLLFISRGLGIGGAQKILTFVANSCDRAGYDVSIISIKSTEPTVSINPNVNIVYLNVNYDSIKSMNGYRKFWSTINLCRQIRSVIKSVSPNIICAFMPDVLILAQLSSIGLRLPIVGSERDNPYKISMFRLIRDNIVYSRCNYMVFQTKRAMDIFNRSVKKKSVIIPNPSIPRKTEVKPYVGERKKVILAAGRLDDVKQFDILILAFKKVLNKHKNYFLHIYGEGPSKEKLNQLILKKKLSDNVILKDAVSDVFAIENDCTAFVLSSKSEGIPNVLIEALSIGIPCISTDCEPGGPRLLLDGGRRGLLVPVGDTDKLASAICKYIDMPEAAQKFGELGMEVNEEFSPEKISKQWIDIFKTI